jgi:hypothetical protein
MDSGFARVTPPCGGLKRNNESFSFGATFRLLISIMYCG